MAYTYSIHCETLADLKDILAALTPEKTPEATPVSFAGPGVGSAVPDGAQSLAPVKEPTEFVEQPKRRGRPPKSAPDPVPVGAADPFATEPQPPGDDPFNAAPDDSGDDPFGTAVAPPVNPSALKLIERLEQKAREVGEPRLLSYAVRMLGLSPSCTLNEVFELLRTGKIPQDAIDRLLDQTGGK